MGWLERLKVAASIAVAVSVVGTILLIVAEVVSLTILLMAYLIRELWNNF